VNIREATPEDAAALIALWEQLLAETPFLLLEPGEATPRVDDYAARMADRSKTENGVTFVAEMEGALVGVIFGNRGNVRRKRHTLSLALAVLEAHWGRGVGRALLAAVEEWASRRKVHRLELSVHVTNERAVALYEKMGFAREGMKRHSLIVNGRFVDELIMSRLLPE
jgi:RimJ/RimL family protein N-acetyltransferase